MRGRHVGNNGKVRVNDYDGCSDPSSKETV